nr:hypothetical protein CFP56_25782 [Quercus suber]
MANDDPDLETNDELDSAAYESPIEQMSWERFWTTTTKQDGAHYLDWPGREGGGKTPPPPPNRSQPWRGFHIPNRTGGLRVAAAAWRHAVRFAGTPVCVLFFHILDRKDQTQEEGRGKGFIISRSLWLSCDCQCRANRMMGEKKGENRSRSFTLLLSGTSECLNSLGANNNNDDDGGRRGGRSPWRLGFLARMMDEMDETLGVSEMGGGGA